MPDLRFSVLGALAQPSAAMPHISLDLLVENEPSSESIHSVLLRCQVRIDPAKRRYNERETRRLSDHFGERARWAQTLRPLLWTHASALISAFQGSTRAELTIPCPMDLELGPARLLFALEEGELPITLLFTGTVFHAGDHGALQVALVPWNREASFRLPVSTIREATAPHLGGRSYLPVTRELLDRLDDYKRAQGLATWEQALGELLPGESAPAQRRAAA